MVYNFKFLKEQIRFQKKAQLTQAFYFILIVSFKKAYSQVIKAITINWH